MSQEHTCFQVYFRGPSWLKHRQQWLVMGSGFHENSNIHIRYDMMWYDHTIFIVIFIIIPVILIIIIAIIAIITLFLNLFLQIWFYTTYISYALAACLQPLVMFQTLVVCVSSTEKLDHLLWESVITKNPHFVRNMYLPLPETNNAAYPWKLVAKGDKPFFGGLSLFLGASCRL